MARTAQLLELLGDLTRAAATHDWEALAAADGRLAVALPELATRGPWTASEQAALAKLHQAHAAAYSQCNDALGMVRERLDELRASRAGWQAYAISDDFEERAP